MKRVSFWLALFLFSAAGSLQAAIKPPILSNVEVGDSYCKIDWEPVDNAVGYNVYIKKDAEGYIQLNDKPITNPYVKLVDLPNGVPHNFAITSLNGDGEESTASITAMVVPIGHSYKVLSVQGGESEMDYRIFTIPFVTERKDPEDFFAYMMPYDKKSWRLFTLEKEGFVEFDAIESIEPGKAYWFLSAKDTDLFLSGTTVNNYDPFFLDLQPGWNVIGSPFLYPVNWEDVLTFNPDYARHIGKAIWEFSDGNFNKVATLDPFRGYFVYNSYSDGFNILIPPVPVKPKILEETGRDEAPKEADPAREPAELLFETEEGPKEETLEAKVEAKVRHESYALQIGIYPVKKKALKMVKRLEQLGLAPFTKKAGYYAKHIIVLEGSYPTYGEAEKRAEILLKQGLRSKIRNRKTGGYSLEMGRYHSSKSADKLARSLQSKGIFVSVETIMDEVEATVILLKDVGSEKKLNEIKEILKKERIEYIAVSG